MSNLILGLGGELLNSDMLGGSDKVLKTEQTFTGDGSTKNFSVDSVFNPNYCEIFLNGINVTKDVDISDGATIKFEDAPDNGDEIYGVFYGSFELADTSTDLKFTTSDAGVILLDRSKKDEDGKPIKYRLFIEDGSIGIEEV